MRLIVVYSHNMSPERVNSKRESMRNVERLLYVNMYDCSRQPSSFPGLIGCLRCYKPWDKSNRNTTNRGVYRK